MKRRNMTLRQLFWIISMLFLHTLRAQQVQFTAHASRTEIGADERIKVDFTANTRYDQFIQPAFKDFYVLSTGDYMSTSIINGRVSSEITKTFILAPKHTGILTVEPAKIVVDGKTYSTEPIQIKVNEGQSPPATSPGKNGLAGRKPQALDRSKDIVFRLELTKTKPYVNEAVGGIYKLYVKDGTRVGDLQVVKLPEYKGFWTQSVSKKIKRLPDTEINGQTYHVYDLGEIVLFPQHDGLLKINPEKIQVVKLVRKVESFGIFREYVDVPVTMTLSGGSKVLRVKPLPKNGKPEDFSGAVGDFSFKAETDKTVLKTGDALTFRMYVQGTGNLGFFDLPELHLPEALEIYEPETKKNTRAGLNGINGKIEKVYTVIPHQPGKYKIPSLTFTYFDPAKEKYITLQTEPINLEVTAGNAIVSNTSPSAPATPGMVFRFIRTNKPAWISIDRKPFYGSFRFYLLLLLILLGFPVTYAFYVWRKKYLSDTDTLARKKTEKYISTLLSDAKKSIGDKNLFYGHLEKALLSFLSNRLRISGVNLKKDVLMKKLAEKGIPGNIINDLNRLWDRIEAARYSPVDMQGMEKDFALMKKLLKELDKMLKK